jgi:hypothetical protein
METTRNKKELNFEFQDNLNVVTIPIKGMSSRTETEIETTLYTLSRPVNTNGNALIDYAIGCLTGVFWNRYRLYSAII